jgi:hypothetical protein
MLAGICLAATIWLSVGAVSLVGEDAPAPPGESKSAGQGTSPGANGFLSDRQAEKIAATDDLETSPKPGPEWWDRLPDWGARGLAWVRRRFESTDWTGYITIPIALGAAAVLLLTRKVLGLLRLLAGICLVASLAAAGYLIWQQHLAG